MLSDVAVAAWLGELGLAVDGFTLSARENGGLVALSGEVVVKVHPARTDPAALAARLALAADPAYGGLLAAPAEKEPIPLPDRPGLEGRVATVWPRLEVLSPDDEHLPWGPAGALLAELHRRSPPVSAPPHGGPARLARALSRLRERDGNGARVVLAAGTRAAADLEATRMQPRLAHGDWHLGQLGRVDSGPWLLIDVDDLGLGDPAWDLARPAGFWAAGLLPDEAWSDFLAAYRAAEGPAVPPGGDPWPVLDGPARAEIVVAAERAIRRVDRDGWDSTGESLVQTCLRMPRTSSAR